MPFIETLNDVRTSIVLGAVIAAFLLLLAAGWVFQAVAVRMDMERDPPPGRLIDIGGMRLHLFCEGNVNAPTIIIEPGSGDDSNNWRGVQDRVAVFGTVCTYDRAGLGWSDAAPPGSRTFEDRASDLERLVDGASLKKPYILVGHSFGGYIVRLFARRRPADVAGIVLVDSSEEGFAFQPAELGAVDELHTKNLYLGMAARFGILRIIAALFPERFKKLVGMPKSYPGPVALYLRASRYVEAADEMSAYRNVPHAMTAPGGFGLLGSLPLTVISRAAADPGADDAAESNWREGQYRLLNLSRKSVQIVATKSGHNIQDSEPDVIADAIRLIWSGGQS